MYAPKFRSWMTSWDRFEEAQEARTQAQGDAILADVRRQIAEAMPKEQEKTEQYNPYLNQFTGDIAKMAAQQQQAINDVGCLYTLGGVFNDWLNNTSRPVSVLRS